MRFESVAAHAFGPLVEEKLELAPGMNVVYGPNEASKSTWHAALYAGLCGMRRSRGQTTPNRDFARRHKPWNGTDRWEVSAVVARDDDVRVELRHDLAARTGTAQDADMAGHDYAPDIIRDGAPDGAVFLGLDRRSFLGTACVPQADIVRVLEAADSLQEALQRAADNAGADATAAAAIDALDRWHRDNVGSARAYKKPLRLAGQRLEQSQERLAEARDAHEEYLYRQAEVERLHAAADQAQRDSSRIEEGSPLRRSAEDAELAARIRAAVDAWSSLPPARAPTGKSLAQLGDDLAKTDNELAAIDSSGSVSRWLLASVGFGIAATIAFAYAGPEFVAAVVFAFTAGIVARRQSRSRQLATLAERRARIESVIEHRREADGRYREDARRRDDVERDLHRAADLGGVPPGATEERSSALERWWLDWQWELAESKELSRRLDGARNDEERARGELDLFTKSMPDVSAAEEAEQDDRLEYDRLQRLDATLQRTIDFLRRAEERVHRDIAPKLRDSVVDHLSRITGGRYTDCRIDPKSLAVEVRGGTDPWRRAERLSHGTAEQIYLLLRMALAEHLSNPNETCPLILDDPIATSDTARREAILDTLLAISASTQVILFTHDADTRDWARERLKEPTGRLQELDRTGIPA